MSNLFFEKPVLNSPYAYPKRHWEPKPRNLSTHHIIGSRSGDPFSHSGQLTARILTLDMSLAEQGTVAPLRAWKVVMPRTQSISTVSAKFQRGGAIPFSAWLSRAKFTSLAPATSLRTTARTRNDHDSI